MSSEVETPPEDEIGRAVSAAVEPVGTSYATLCGNKIKEDPEDKDVKAFATPSDPESLKSSKYFHDTLSNFLSRVVIFRDDIEPPLHQESSHPREPIEWELWEDFMKVGTVEHCSSMMCQREVICCLVFHEPESVIAMRKLGGWDKHCECGEFIEPEPEHIPLIRYSQVVSDALASRPQTLNLRTDCLLDPVYEPRYSGTTGFLAPADAVLSHVAYPVPGDIIDCLFQFRTFMCVPGHQEGAVKLEDGQKRESPFLPLEDEDEGDWDYSHLRQLSNPWPLKLHPTNQERLKMRLSIQDSLNRGCIETALIPSPQSLATRETCKPEVKSTIGPSESGDFPLSKDSLDKFMLRVAIFRDDMEPGACGILHPREPIEWDLCEDLAKFGIIEHCSSMYEDGARICCVVFRDPSSLIASRKIWKSYSSWGEFIGVDDNHITLFRYCQIVSDSLASRPQSLKLHTECLMEPVYEPRYNGTTGFLAPLNDILGRVAPPVPGDVVNRLHHFRTFTCVPGHQAGAVKLEGDENRPNPFLDDNYDGDGYEHVCPPSNPWPFKVQPTYHEVRQMRESIQASLEQEFAETKLTPSLGELANRNEVVKKELLKVAPTITPKPTVFSVAKNGLKGNLRLIRPSAYDPRCIVIVSVPVKKGGSNIPPSVASVMKIRGCFKRYGPISHVLGYEAKGATTREYYVTFKEAASAAKVYAESECVQGRNPHLTLQRCVPLPASYGDWLARFCVDKTVLPDNCVYLSSTHPSNLNATLTLSHAACEPAIEPIPQVTLPSTSVPLDQGASYVPQSTETKASMKAMKAINNVLLRAEEIRGSLLPTKGVPRVSALEMIKTAGRLYDIELALMTYPEIPRPDRLTCILQAISHIPDFIIPDNDIYNIRRRCQHLLGSPASAVGPPTIAPSLSGKTFVVPSVSYNTLPSHPVLQNSLPGRPILPAPPSTRDKRTGPPQSMAQKPQLPSHLHQPGINQNLSLSNSHHFGLADRRVSVKREREYDMDRPDSRDDLDVKRLRY